MSAISRAVNGGIRPRLLSRLSVRHNTIGGIPKAIPSGCYGVVGTRTWSSSVFVPGVQSHKWNPPCSCAPSSRTTHSHRSHYRTVVSNLFSNTSNSQTRYCSHSSRPPTTMTQSQKSSRLPTDVVPAHYDVAIRTDLEKLEFNGWATIE